jgi:hypothetical protein
MGTRREIFAFCAVLAVCVAALFHESLIGGKVLSPADALLVSASFRDGSGGDYEPANRLLMDPVLQFQPWLEFNVRMVRSGRLPLWNGNAGCGTPHLANGQSAVFDPFHLFAYLGDVPDAYARIAAGRLWGAGLGMFMLARAWGLGLWGRWFAGLVYPFSGFLVVWLLFPVTAVAIWLPWLLLATDRVFRWPAPRAAGCIAVVVTLVILGGHIQTSAHVLLAAGIYALTIGWQDRANRSVLRRAMIAWVLGIGLGLAVSAVQILPLGFYLAKSPVWGDRLRERTPWWRIAPPRLLDAVCTAAPYAYGSQRRGHPNLARALGVHNLNESAGGFAGLATLIWLAPLAVVTRGRSPRVVYLSSLVVIGAMAAFRLPPIDNLLRGLPVLDVTDNRRLTLWVAFGLTMLGGIGLDQLDQTRRLSRSWLALWLVAALLAGSLPIAVRYFEPALRERATAHYLHAASLAQGADLTVYQQRAERQVRQTLDFLPRYHALIAFELGVLTALAVWLRRSPRGRFPIRLVVLGLTLGDVGAFGIGLNPAISRELHRFEPPVIGRLRAGLPPGSRAIGLGEELPPNVLMRFGLSDARNYDSVELARSLDWFAPLYEAANGTRTSRSKLTWTGVIRSRERLADSSVGAIVAAVPPPAGDFCRIENAGDVWIAWLVAKPWANFESGQGNLSFIRDNGRARILVDAIAADRLVVRETWDPGWNALLDGKPVEIQAKSGVFLDIQVPSGQHELVLEYDPIEVRVGLGVSTGALVLLILVLTGIRLF